MADSITDAALCPSRRVFLASAGAFVAWASLPRAAYAAQGRDEVRVRVVLLSLEQAERRLHRPRALERGVEASYDGRHHS